MKCACGQTALYRVGKLGFCASHRSNAVQINALMPKRGSVFVSDKSMSLASGGGASKVYRHQFNVKEDQRKFKSSGTSRNLRDKATSAELQLIAVMAEHPKTANRYKFQEVLCGFYPDFVNHWENIVIEVDGWHHTTPEGKKRDYTRRKVWISKGYRVLRFFNREVLATPEKCLEAILEYQQGLVPSFGSCYPIAVTKAP